MSLILEALRKSEAERRRGQAPQLFDAPVAAAPVAPKRSLQALWWAVPVVLAAALLVSWRYSATPESEGDAVSGPAGAATLVPQVRPAAPPAGQPSPGTGAAPSGPVDAPRSVRAPAAASGRAVAASNSESGPDAPSAPESPMRPVGPATRSLSTGTTQPRAGSGPVEHVNAADATTTAFSQPSASPREPAPGSAQPPASAPTPEAPQSPSGLALPPPAAAAASTARTAADATAAGSRRAPRESDTEPLRLADLTPVERRSLPPLKMSMHMWSADATQRFVILDGTRVGEGDRVGEGVIEEITRDGAVLAWSGRRVKLPVR